MSQVIQLCYIVSLLVGIAAFMLQLMVRSKNLAVSNQMVKEQNTTIFLAVIVAFNACDFLILFLGTSLGGQSTSWIFVVENVLEVALAFVLIEMERDYFMVEERGRGLSTFFAVIAAVILWTDTMYTAGIMITSEGVYTIMMIGLNLLPVMAVIFFSVRYFRNIVGISRHTLTEGYFAIYNLVFIFLCIVTTISILDSRTEHDYIGNDKEVYVIFWFLFNVMNGIFVWRSCQVVTDTAQAPVESAEERLIRMAEEFGLSGRELEIARMLCKGKNNNDIAAELFLSTNTVKVHTSNLYKKLGVKNRVQAVQVLRGEEIE